MRSFSIAVMVLVPAITTLMAEGTSAYAKTIKFSGYDWEIRPSEKNGGPGPNRWEENNVSVDPSGYLHLKLTARRPVVLRRGLHPESHGVRSLRVPDRGTGGPARPQCRVRVVQLSPARGRPGWHERDRHRVCQVGQPFRDGRQLHGLARSGRLAADHPQRCHGPRRRGPGRCTVSRGVPPA